MPTDRHSLERLDRPGNLSREDQAWYLNVLARWARGEIGIADIGVDTLRSEAAKRNN